jgi:biotin synthase-related radical SAM superfamily protein
MNDKAIIPQMPAWPKPSEQRTTCGIVCQAVSWFADVGSGEPAAFLCGPLAPFEQTEYHAWARAKGRLGLLSRTVRLTAGLLTSPSSKAIMLKKEVALIRVSIGTAGILGLRQVPMAVAPTTAYLMLGGRCAMNCAFCAQARESESGDEALSRVTWPEFPLGKVCTRLKRAEHQGTLERCCIQVTAGRDAYRQVLHAVQRIRRSTSLPLNVAILPANLKQVAELLEAGVDSIGLGLDAACERVFQQMKGPHWEYMLSTIETAAEWFPGRVSVHLIVGLGETERELVARILWARDLGLGVGLFAFTPVRGTSLAERLSPPLGQYRRIQAARRLIVYRGAGMADFAFNERGTLVAIGLTDWRRSLADGEAFRTSGCPGCNRPFYNERPGGTTYNYARPLTEDEAQRATMEMEIEIED